MTTDLVSSTDQLSQLLRRLADRDRVRSEATVQADIRQLLRTGGLCLEDHDLDVQLETQVGDRRRIDVEVGLTVIKVKKDLCNAAVVQAAEEQLAGYVATRAAQTAQHYVGTLTDGREWRAYHERLMPESSTESAAAYGALHMRAAVIAARAGHAVRAHEHLDEAGCIACRIPEGIYHGTAFGSASVRIHRVTLAIDLDDADAALRFGAEWVPPSETPAERRLHYYVDLGRVHLRAGQYDHAIGALRAAREIAPQHIRVHPDVRQTLFTLLEIGVSEVTEFAEWTRGPGNLD